MTTPNQPQDPIPLTTFLTTLLRPANRPELTNSVLPGLLRAVHRVAETLRTSHNVTQVGTANLFGDEQLNVDVAADTIIRSACAACPSIVTTSSEEDPVERPSRVAAGVSSKEEYTVAFDPLDGSSIIAPNWSVGAILGVWDGATALGGQQPPSEKLVAAVLGVFGPRTTAFVAVRIPGGAAVKPICFEVSLAPGTEHITVVCPRVDLAAAAPFKTRYFQPANLRAAADSPAYAGLVSHYIAQRYTLRYSGGLVPDVVHSLVKGHGIYLSPVTATSTAKLRRLYELCPVALVVECAGGKAVDPADIGPNGGFRRVLDRPVLNCDERGGLLCGNVDEVDFASQSLSG